jgi:hypothetical protein
MADSKYEGVEITGFSVPYSGYFFNFVSIGIFVLHVPGIFHEFRIMQFLSQLLLGGESFTKLFEIIGCVMVTRSIQSVYFIASTPLNDHP